MDQSQVDFLEEEVSVWKGLREGGGSRRSKVGEVNLPL